MRLAVLAPFTSSRVLRATYGCSSAIECLPSVCLPSLQWRLHRTSLRCHVRRTRQWREPEYGATVLSARAMKELRRLIDNPMEDVRGTLPARPARQTCGFSLMDGVHVRAAADLPTPCQRPSVCVTSMPEAANPRAHGHGWLLRVRRPRREVGRRRAQECLFTRACEWQCAGADVRVDRHKIRAHLVQQSLNEVQTPAVGRRPQTSPARRRR